MAKGNFLKHLGKVRKRTLPFLIGIVAILVPIIYFGLKNTNQVEAANWWGSGEAWAKRKQLTVINDSTENLASGTTVAITINTKELAASRGLQNDCDDLRVIYQNGSTETEVDRHLVFENDGSCWNSKATKVYFPLQAALNSTATDTNYYLYYKNEQATSPTTTINAFDFGSASALFVCPFNQTSDCLNSTGSVVAATETGAIRYDGQNSAIKFSNTGFINISDHADLSSLKQFTLENWVYFEHEPDVSDIYPIISKGNSAGNKEYRMRIIGASGADSLNCHFSTTGSNEVGGSASYTFEESTWYHIACSWDGSNVRLFVNGNLENTITSATGTMYDAGVDLRIGTYSDGTNYMEHTIIDETRISNISRYSSSFTAPTKPFVRDEYTMLLYHYDENGTDPRSSLLFDDSGRGHVGTLTQATFVGGLTGINKDNDFGKVSGSNSYAGHEGIYLEESTTNKIINPSFEYAGDYDYGWDSIGANLTPTEVDITAISIDELVYFGNKSMDIVASGTGDNNVTIGINPGNTNTHTLSAYVRTYNGGTIDNTVAQLVWEGAAQSSTSYTYIGHGWYRLDYTNTTTNSTNEYGLYVTNGSAIYMDGFQLEEYAYATSYAVGSLLSDAGGVNTYFWDDDCDGTLDAGEDEIADQNAQCSTRIVSELDYAGTSNISDSAGTIQFWFKHPIDEYESGNYDNFLIDAFYTDTNRILIRHRNNNGGEIIATLYPNSPSAESANVTSLGFDNEWHHVVITWESGGDLNLYVDNTASTPNALAGVPSGLASGTINLGNSNYSDTEANSVFSDFRIYGQAIASSEVTDLYYAGLVSHTQDITVDRFDSNKGQNPIAIWHMDEGTSNSCQNGTDDICDSSLFGNDLYLGVGNSAPAWKVGPGAAGSVGDRFLRFDGIDDFIAKDNDTAINFDSNEGFTINGWFRHSATAPASSTEDYLITKYDDAGGFKIWMDESGYVCGAIDSDGTWGTSFYDSVCSTATQGSLADSKWHNFSLVKDGTTSLTLYIDANQVAQDTSIAATGDIKDTSNVYIGSDNIPGSEVWNGDLDEVTIYLYARNSTQIKADLATPQAASRIGSGQNDALSDGLVGYWNLDIGATGSGQTAYDLSGNAANGTTSDSDATLDCNITGKFNDGCDFDGIDDFIDMGDQDIYDYGGDITLSAWVQFHANEDTRIISKDNGGAERGFQLRADAGTSGPQVYIADGGIACDLSSNFTSNLSQELSLNTWHHIVGVIKTGEFARIYVDGVLANENTSNIPTTLCGSNNDSSMYIGRRTTTYSEILLDEVRIYNKALSSINVSNLYNWAPGPIGYWKFDENSGTTTTADTSGNGNNGTLNGTMTESDWVRGKFGNALEVDGIDDYIDLGTTPWQNVDSVTVSFWLKAPVPTATSYPFNRYQNSSDGWGLRMLTNGFIQVYNDIDNAGDTSCQTNNITANEWNYITATLSNNGDGTYRNNLYINGVSENCTNNATGSWNSYTGGAYVGARNSTPDEEFKGTVDELKIYNYLRTPSQIIEDMNAGHPIGGSPIGSQALYLNFDEMYGDTANDTSPQSINGNLAGSGQVCPATGDTSCPTWSASGKINGALDFDTSGTNDDFIESGTLPVSDYPLTITAWIKTPGGVNGTVFALGDISGTDAIALEVPSTGYAVARISSGGVDDLTGTILVDDDEWHYLTAVFASATDRRLYVDGKADGTDSDSKTYPSSMDTWSVGIESDSSRSRWFDGLIDEVKVYSSALTQEQILIDMTGNSSAAFGNVGTKENTTIIDGAGSEPIMYMNFNENTGTTTYDYSGNGNDGTLNGSMTESDWIIGPKGFSSALNFDGTDDYVEIGTDSLVDNSTQGSISAWIYPEDMGTVNRAIFGYGGATAGFAGRLEFYTYNGGLFIAQYSNGESPNWVRSPYSVLTANKWHHVTVTSEGTTWNLYINGVKQALSVGSGTNNGNWLGDTTATATVHTSIGRIFHNGSWKEEFLGSIDEVKLYDYERSHAQVAYDYNRGSPVAHWQFDECQGTTAYDSSDSGINGTISAGNSSGSNDYTGTCSSGASDEMWNNGSTGKFNASLDFDGTNDYVGMSTPDFATSTYSASLWFKTTTTALDQLLDIVETGNKAPLHVYIDDFVGFTISDNSSTTVDSNTGTKYFNDGNWHHVVAIRRGEDNGTVEAELYVDGISYGTGSNTLTTTNTAGNLEVGRRMRDGTDTRYFDGQIDDVQIYNYELSEAQILKIMNQNSGLRFRN